MPQLTDLYNHYILGSPATFDIEPFTLEARKKWFSHYGVTGRHRLFVATDEGVVLGFASSSPFRPKAAYETSVETSVYISDGQTGRGIGKALYAKLLEELGAEDVHRAYAGITMPNPASVALHESFGFRQVAYFSEQGRKFGRYWDVAWYERRMD